VKGDTNSKMIRALMTSSAKAWCD